jgi:hypothetical protein
LTGSDRNRNWSRICRRLAGAPPARSAAARALLWYDPGRGSPARALCTMLAPYCLSLGSLADLSHRAPGRIGVDGRSLRAAVVVVFNAKSGAKSRHEMVGFLPIVRDGGSWGAKGAKEVALSFWLWISIRPGPLTSVICHRATGPTGPLLPTPVSGTASLFRKGTRRFGARR